MCQPERRRILYTVSGDTDRPGDRRSCASSALSSNLLAAPLPPAVFGGEIGTVCAAVLLRLSLSGVRGS